MGVRRTSDVPERRLTDYPRPSVAVDVALLSVADRADGGRGLHVLLHRRSERYATGAWSLPGTFLHEGERLSDAVLRALRDKVGVEGRTPRQLAVLDEPGRDTRGWVLSVAHVDVVAAEMLARAVSREDVRLCPVVGDPPDLVVPEGQTGLPFDHDKIVMLAADAVRSEYAVRPDPAGLLSAPEGFTLRELQRLHEAVLDRRLHKDTFRRRMTPQLTATGKPAKGRRGAPAELFRRPADAVWTDLPRPPRGAGRARAHRPSGRADATVPDEGGATPDAEIRG